MEDPMSSRTIRPLCLLILAASVSVLAQSPPEPSRSLANFSQMVQKQQPSSGAPAKASIPNFKSPLMQKLFKTMEEHQGNAVARPMQTGSNTSVSPFLSSAPSYDVGSQPLGIALGDFNGDGKQDVVTAAAPPVILLGNGDGTLQTAVNIGTTAATDVAVGDFNRDGNLDVAFAIPGAALVYLGNGDGTFGSGTVFSNGSTNNDGLAHILAADVNNDGIPDLILNTDAGVSVLLGNGNGTFRAPISTTSAGFVLSMMNADFNGDGRLDLAVTNGFSTLSILLGNGNGSFSLASSYSTIVSNLNSVATGDFNRDGVADVALPNGQIFLGNGNGTLQPPSTFPTVPAAKIVAAVDVNGNGITDLITLSSGQGFECGTGDFGSVGISLGNGNGTFQSPVIFDSGGCTYPSFLAIGDLNNDNRPDLVTDAVMSGVGEVFDSVAVLLNQGKANFGGAQLNESGGAGSIAVGDFNRDGKLDLIFSDGSTYLGNGDGTLRFLTSANLSGLDISVADFRGNGLLDLAEAEECETQGCANGALLVNLGNGNGTFQTATTYASGGFYPESLAIADFNGDGILDVALLNTCVDVNCVSAGGSVSLFFGNADGTFSVGSTISLTQAPYGGNPTVLVAGDFNNDGNIDLAALGCVSGGCLFTDPSMVVSTLLGNGNGTFQSPSITAVETDDGVTAAVAGDFNQDGILDIAVADGAACSDCGAHGIFLYGNGDGTFSTGPGIGTEGGPPVSIVASDFYGVGLPTPVLANRCGDPLDCPFGSVMINGTSNITEIMLLYLAAGDFNNDGKPDLAGSLQYDNGASVLLNTGATLAATTTMLAPAGLQAYFALQRVTFAATVTHTGPRVPSGQVNFLDNGVSIGSAALARNGQAILNTNQLAVGSHFIVAYYSGDIDFAASNSLGAHVTIRPASTTTTIASSVNPSTYGQPVQFTATIAPQFGGSATGTVTFYDDGTQIGSAAVNRNKAIFTTGALQTGFHSITARYSGSSNFQTSTSSPESQAVRPATTTTAVTSSPNPSQTGQSVTFIAAITGQFSGTLSGSVVFLQAGKVLSSVPLSGGTAVYSTSSLSKGSHQILARYSGDSNDLPSQEIVNQIVQ
jgi:hypothetical protein